MVVGQVDQRSLSSRVSISIKLIIKLIWIVSLENKSHAKWAAEVNFRGHCQVNQRSIVSIVPLIWILDLKNIENQSRSTSIEVIPSRPMGCS